MFVNGYSPFGSDEIFDCKTGELISSPLYSSFHTFYVDTKPEAITVQKLQFEINSAIARVIDWHIIVTQYIF